MSIFLSSLRLKRVRTALAIIAGLTAGSLIGLRATHSEIIKQRPCDIYAAESTPCVAAHSTVRSLYAKYTGALKAATSELSAQGSGAPPVVGHLVHERSKSNDDFGCSLTVESDTIERLADSFQIWLFGAQPV